ncbi:hypothetical protein [Methylobacterium sp. sgz302541]|uniref:hypothetical protein n=1 Tax=unclassified Methylobacterium TaxID=2615210 RepID=UPI003D33B885
MPTSIPASLHRAASATARQQQERIQFRVILAATYPFFLAAAAAQRLRSGTAVAAAGRRRSVFGEAKAMAVSALPFAFMG